jgi:Protein of unknown function (DUF3551)
MNPNRTATGKQAIGAGLALGIIAALVAAPSRAQAGWCATAFGPDGGFVNCGYATWQQCRAAVSGQGGICHANPGR